MAEGKFSGGDGVTRRGVHHDDATVGGSIDINIINTHAGTADTDELVGGGEDLARDLGFGANEDGMDVANQGQELLRG